MFGNRCVLLWDVEELRNLLRLRHFFAEYSLRYKNKLSREKFCSASKPVVLCYLSAAQI